MSFSFSLFGQPDWTHSCSVATFVSNIMFSSSISRFLLLGSLLTILVAASVRHPHAPGHMAAFVHPRATTTTHGRGGVHAISTRQPSRTRGEARVGVKGVKLHAAAKSAAGSKKKTTAKKTAAKTGKSDVESFKKSEFIASIAEKTGFTRAESEDALQAVLDTLTEVRFGIR